MLILSIILAVFLIGGGGRWIATQIVGYCRDKAMHAELARAERRRAVETDRALRETLVMIAERTTSTDRAKAA